MGIRGGGGVISSSQDPKARWWWVLVVDDDASVRALPVDPLGPAGFEGRATDDVRRFGCFHGT